MRATTATLLLDAREPIESVQDLLDQRLVSRRRLAIAWLVRPAREWIMAWALETLPSLWRSVASIIRRSASRKEEPI